MMKRFAGWISRWIAVERLDALIGLLAIAASLRLVLWGGFKLARTFYGDPVIYLSYARRIAAGDFFAFNPGEFSSGSTSPLWALILGGGFMFGDGIVAAKVISATATALAVFATYRLSWEVSRSHTGSGAGTVLVCSYLALPGNLLYESGLAVALSCAIAILTWRAINTPGGLSAVRLRRLAAAWAAMPLIRPDGYLVVALSVAALGWIGRSDRSGLKRLATTAAVAQIPALLYFGYSYAALGSWSVSSYCRMFALREFAATAWGVSCSTATLELFRAFPVYWWAVFAVLGIWMAFRRRVMAPVATWFLLAVPLAYLAVQTVVVPVGAGAGRYYLPAWPYVAALAAIGMAAIMRYSRRPWIVRLAFLAAVLCAFSLQKHTGRRIDAESQRGLTLDVVVERDVVEYINSVAEPGATILMYEVQDRLWLRDDLVVLSLDGITDGKVGPYLQSEDVIAFVRRYRPDYWLANDAVTYRPFLRGGPLRSVVEQTGDAVGDTVTVQGVTFTNLRVREKEIPDGFAGYRQLYRLTYGT